MKGLFLCLLIMIPFSFLKAQHNSLSTLHKENKKGVFYLSYEEFANDSPSKKLDFTIQYLPAGENDSMVVRATYSMPDSLDNFDFWGFSDGQNTFIQTSTIAKLKFARPNAKAKILICTLQDLLAVVNGCEQVILDLATGRTQNMDCILSIKKAR